MNHLDTVGESYLRHSKEGIRLAARLAFASIACFIHSLVPKLFTNTTSQIMTTELARVKNRLVTTSHIQIRYNTKAGTTNLVWRIIVDGEEFLASSVVVFGTVYSEQSIVDGIEKFNLACDGVPTWENGMVVIEA
jgi:hypothetical protein